MGNGYIREVVVPVSWDVAKMEVATVLLNHLGVEAGEYIDRLEALPTRERFEAEVFKLQSAFDDDTNTALRLLYPKIKS